MRKRYLCTRITSYIHIYIYTLVEIPLKISSHIYRTLPVSEDFHQYTCMRLAVRRGYGLWGLLSAASIIEMLKAKDREKLFIV